MESGEVKKCYEWRSGFRSGQVECYLAETETTVYFESGNSIPKDRLEFDLFQIDEEIYNQKSRIAQVQSEQQNSWEAMNQSIISLMPTEIPSSNPSSNPPSIERSPIQIILDKNKKKESRNISVSLEIEIPSNKVVDLLTTMFDEDEVYQEIVTTCLSKYKNEDLKKLIEESIIKVIREDFNTDK
jgi:hypothetical protein